VVRFSFDVPALPVLPPFTAIALVLLAAALIGAIGAMLRQPLIVSFIAVGVLVGPAGIGLVTAQQEIELLASIGIALLLFVVGLKLDVHTMRALGPVALATGLGQTVITSAVGFAIALALGLQPTAAGYVAVALTFSSTIIVVKLLSDKQEIDALHGRIAVGFLIVQDVLVILAMIGITAAGSAPGADQSLLQHAAMVLLKGLGFLAVVALLSVRVLPALATYVARWPELLVLFGIAWAVVLSAAGEALDLTKEVGAFVAGASLASTPYREAIGSRLVSVRDFLLLFFFIDLGARLDLSLLRATIVPAAVLTLFVLAGKPIIMMGIMGALGYRKRTSFLAGLTAAPISEFSLILTRLGMSVGHITPETVGLITTVGLVTIAVSTYLIIDSGAIYERIAPWLGLFERRAPYRERERDAAPAAADVIVLGLGRYGGGIVRHLRLRGRRVIGVDFDPQALARWRAEGIPVIYGDASDPDLFDHLPLAHVTWIVSTAREVETSRALLRHLQRRRFTGKIAVTCRTADEGDMLRLEGADLLLRPYADASEQAADALTTALQRLGTVASAAPGLREIRLATTSMWAGRRIEEVPLREEFGATVLAVSRGGRSVFNPGPSFQLFPGDRLILSGDPASLERAVEYLAKVDESARDHPPEDFGVSEVEVKDIPGWEGRNLAELALPARFGVSAIAMTRGQDRLEAPDPQRPLAAHDRLVLAGPRDAMARARGG
jgi:Kef-type K+ transport system membrane component KefB/Trk K+ transport system NAD-binding subunit